MIVSFDAHGTLFEEADDHYDRIAEILHAPVDEVTFFCNRYTESTLKLYPKIVSDDIINTFWFNFYTQLALYVGSPFSGRVDQVMQYTTSSSAWKLKSSGMRLFNFVRDTYSIIACTEWNTGIIEILYGLGVHILNVYISANIGYAKSHPMFWCYVLRRECIPSELLHIGDNVQLDEVVPKTFGIQTINVNDEFAFDKIRKLL